MNKYEIECKYYYYETSEYDDDIIKAPTKTLALAKFAKQRKLGKVNCRSYEKWQWWEGDWLVRIKHIKRLTKE